MAEDSIEDKGKPSGKNVADRDDENLPEDEARPETVEAAPDEDGEKAKKSPTEETVSQEKKQPDAQPDPLASANDSPEQIQAVEDFDLNLLLEIPLEITVELGRKRVRIQELLELAPGSTVSLAKLENEPVDILANDKLIARGKVVLQNKKYGIRITEITSRMNRIKSLH
ncbi:MAG: flagellar motor switch protein FliN [Desulfobacterales bacterium]